MKAPRGDAERRIAMWYKLMFETMTAASCLYELIYEDGEAVDCRILDMNPAFEKVFGWTRGDVLGQRASTLFREGKDERLPFIETYARVAQTGQPASFEAFFPSVGKSMEMAASSPSRGFLQIIFTDITERKELEKKNAYLASFPALNGNPVLEIGTDGALRYANAAALKALSRLGLGQDARQFLPGQPEELAELHSRCLQKPQRQEFTLGVAAFLRDVNASGEDALRVYAVDITKRHQLEKEIRLLNAELDLRVQRRTAELSAANRELEAYSYSVSHDLRTPLRSIDGFSHAFLEDFGDLVPEAGRHYLERIRSSAQRMGQLIEDMLQLSQITRHESNLQPIDISALASDIAQNLIKTAPERNVRWDIEGGMAAICDPHLTQIILANLLDNAWKFTSKRANANITVGTAEDPERGPAFFVRDDGAGFDEKYIGKLFTAFQRLHSQAEYPGTGVGLATVERAVRRLGGTVWAEGEVDRGATFYFTIPVPQTSAQSKETQR